MSVYYSNWIPSKLSSILYLTSVDSFDLTVFADQQIQLLASLTGQRHDDVRNVSKLGRRGFPIRLR